MSPLEGGVIFPFSAVQRSSGLIEALLLPGRTDTVSAQSRNLQPPAESPAAILSNWFDFSLHFLVHFLSRRLTSTWPLLSPLLDDITFLALLAWSAV